MHSFNGTSGKTPFILARLSVQHTKKTCAIALIIPFGCIALVALFPPTINNPTDHQFTLRTGEKVGLYYARLAAREKFAFNSRENSRTSRSLHKDIIVLLRNSYNDSKEGVRPIMFGKSMKSVQNNKTLLSPEAVAFLKQEEDALLKSEEYSKLCLANLAKSRDCSGNLVPCTWIHSITNHPNLYGMYNDDNNFCGRRESSDPVTTEQFNYFKEDIGFETGSINPRWQDFVSENFTKGPNYQAFRSIIAIGGDHFSENASSYSTKDGESLYSKWTSALASTFEKDNTDQYHSLLFSIDRIKGTFQPIILRDIKLAIVSIVLVFFIVWIHTTTEFLAIATIFNILLSFPCTYVIYRYIFQISYLGGLQLMAIFLLLGIGADDAFVFTDAWKQAPIAVGLQATLEERMDYAWRRAVKAMSVTSFSTAVAFFATATSPIVPISTLGIWAAFLVITQFVLVSTVYPSALIMWTRFWRVRKWYRFYRLSPEFADPSLLVRQRSLRQKMLTARDGELRPIEKIFRGPWTHLTWLIRWPLIVVCLVLIGLSIWLGSRLGTPVELEKFLPETHKLQRAHTILSEGFPTRKERSYVTSSVMWGLKGVKRYNRYDPEDFGEVILDDSFDIKSESAQWRMLEACLIFGSLTDYPELTKCWPRDYLIWRLATNRTSFQTFTSDEELVQDLVAFSSVSGVFLDQQIMLSEDKKKVVFSELRFLTKSNSLQPAKLMIPEKEKWIKHVKEFNGNTTIDGVKSAYVTGGLAWVWAETQVELFNNMKSSVLLVLGISLISLTVSTGNIIVAFLALLCIFGILSNVLALIFLLGWELGVTESIGVVASIGFSFDYIAHVANAYVESPRDLDNINRIRAALTELGVSVIAGAISTSLAGSMLLFAVLIFFKKFGIFVVATVALALIWSLVFFPAFLHVFGPTNNTGELWVALRKLLGSKKQQKEQKPLRRRFPTIDGWTMDDDDIGS